MQQVYGCMWRSYSVIFMERFPSWNHSCWSHSISMDVKNVIPWSPDTWTAPRKKVPNVLSQYHIVMVVRRTYIWSQLNPKSKGNIFWYETDFSKNKNKNSKFSFFSKKKSYRLRTLRTFLYNAAHMSTKDISYFYALCMRRHYLIHGIYPAPFNVFPRSLLPSGCREGGGGPSDTVFLKPCWNQLKMCSLISATIL